MADFTRELSQEYWRPAPAPGRDFQAHSFPPRGEQAYCVHCGTQYAVGALYCHLCGVHREDDLHARKRTPILQRMNLERLRARTGLSTVSLGLVLIACLFMIACVMTGLVYSTSTLAEWQAVQTWKIEWLVAATVALVGAVLFKKS